MGKKALLASLLIVLAGCGSAGTSNSGNSSTSSNSGGNGSNTTPTPQMQSGPWEFNVQNGQKFEVDLQVSQTGIPELATGVMFAALGSGSNQPYQGLSPENGLPGYALTAQAVQGAQVSMTFLCSSGCVGNVQMIFNGTIQSSSSVTGTFQQVLNGAAQPAVAFTGTLISAQVASSYYGNITMFNQSGQPMFSDLGMQVTFGQLNTDGHYGLSPQVTFTGALDGEFTFSGHQDGSAFILLGPINGQQTTLALYLDSSGTYAAPGTIIVFQMTGSPSTPVGQLCGALLP